MTHSCDFSCNHDNFDPATTVTVDRAALRQVLAALIGAEHEIRELQFTRSLGNNPINLLVRQYNEQVEK